MCSPCLMWIHRHRHECTQYIQTVYMGARLSLMILEGSFYYLFILDYLFNWFIYWYWKITQSNMEKKGLSSESRFLVDHNERTWETPVKCLCRTRQHMRHFFGLCAVHLWCEMLLKSSNIDTDYLILEQVMGMEYAMTALKTKTQRKTPENKRLSKENRMEL